jgi:hypothetical protein
MTPLFVVPDPKCRHALPHSECSLDLRRLHRPAKRRTWGGARLSLWIALVAVAALALFRF